LGFNDAISFAGQKIAQDLAVVRLIFTTKMRFVILDVLPTTGRA
jgi:hypothetical protein